MVLGAIGGKVPIPGPFRVKGLLCRTCRPVEISLLQLQYCGREEAAWFPPSHLCLELAPRHGICPGMAVRTGFPVFRTWTLGEEVFLKRKAGRHALC